MHYSWWYLYALQQYLYNTACIIVTPACMLQVQYNIKYQYRYYILYIILVIYYLWLVGIPLDSTSKMFTSFFFSFHLLPLIILISIFVIVSSIAFLALGLVHTSTSINNPVLNRACKYACRLIRIQDKMCNQAKDNDLLSFASSIISYYYYYELHDLRFDPYRFTE